jgi:RimJ/RimL family protein N-acetyltransferase
MGTDERYQRAIADFDASISNATRVSRAAAGRTVPDPAWWASLLYTRLCVTGVSLLSLAPGSRFAGRSIGHYDFSAVASITRNVWECYFVFFYLGVDATQGDEWLTRLNILQLHDCTSRFKMFTELDPGDANGAGFQAQADQLRDRINSRAYFGTLPERRRKHVLKGDNALLLSQDELLKRMNEDISLFRGMYRFLSFHVHSLPVAFYRMAEREQGRGIESDWEKGNIANALEFARRPIVRATQEMRGLFPDLPETRPEAVPEGGAQGGARLMPVVRGRMSVQLRTSRLVLRPFSEEDTYSFLEIECEPDVQTFLHTTCDEVDSYRRLQGAIEDVARDGYGLLALSLAGRVIGFGGLTRCEIESPEARQVVVAVLREWRDNGFAQETLRELLRWGFENRGLKRVLCVARADNVQSLCLLGKLGAAYVRERPRWGEEPLELVYELLPEADGA